LRYYLASAVAQASVSLATISSASSLETHSLTTFGAQSTKSLASFNHNQVISLTTLITQILEAQAAVNSTSKDVFSSAASHQAAAHQAATATGAAADTQNSSSKCFTKLARSITDKVLTASRIHCASLDNSGRFFSSDII
jgi:hypothetical protein